MDALEGTPFCESKTLCRRLKKQKGFRQNRQLIIAKRGVSAKRTSPVARPHGKVNRDKVFYATFYAESKKAGILLLAF